MQTKEKIKYQFKYKASMTINFLFFLSFKGFLVKPIVSRTKNPSKALTKYERPKIKRYARKKCNLFIYLT